MSRLWLAFAIFPLVGCGLAGELRDNAGELRKTQRTMHNQVLAVALEGMFRPDNTVNLSPPARMMPFAEAFAREASEEEAVRTCYLLWQDAAQGQPEAGKPESKKPFLVSVTGMAAISGLLPAEKFRSILRQQIEQGGRYADTAYVMALSRYNFQRDFLFRSVVELTTHLTPGALDDAIKSFNELKWIAALPYTGRLVLEIPQLEIKEALDPNEVKLLGRKARRRFERDMTRSSPRTTELLKNFDA